MTEKKETKLDNLLRWFKNHKIFSYVLLICIGLIAVNEFTDASDKLLRRVGIIKTLDVTSNSIKSELSQNIIRTAWNRMFWTRNYTEKVKRGAPAIEIEKSWDKYMIAIEKWSSEIMIYYISLDKFYPNTEKRRILESRVQPKFEAIASKMANLKYSLSDSTVNHSILANEIQDMNNELNVDLYFFIYELESKE